MVCYMFAPGYKFGWLSDVVSADLLPKIETQKSFGQLSKVQSGRNGPVPGAC